MRCAAQPSRCRSVSNISRRSMSRKSCVTWPTQDDRAKSGVLPVISTLPIRSVCRRLSPVDVATKVVAVWYSAYPNVAISARRASSYNCAQLRHEADRTRGCPSPREARSSRPARPFLRAAACNRAPRDGARTRPRTRGRSPRAARAESTCASPTRRGGRRSKSPTAAPRRRRRWSSPCCAPTGC